MELTYLKSSKEDIFWNWSVSNYAIRGENATVFSFGLHIINDHSKQDNSG